MEVKQIALEDIDPDRDQPRKQFDPERLADLTGSIERKGIINPLFVQELKSGGYRLIDGERRFRAAKEASGITTAPCIVYAPDDRADRLVTQFEIQHQHEDWDETETAIALNKIAKEMDATMTELCNTIGIDKNDRETYNAILRLSDPMMIQNRGLGSRWAKHIQRLRNTAKNQYKKQNDVELTEGDIEKFEQTVVERVAKGEIKSSDVSKLQATIIENADTVDTLMDGRKSINPEELYKETGAQLEREERNTRYTATQFITKLNRLSEKNASFDPQEETVEEVERVQEAAKTFLKFYG